MITIKELLKKIKFDKRLNPDEFLIYYLDRISENLIEIRYDDIVRLDGNFMVLEKNNDEVEIPLHRIRAVKEREKVIWKRKL